MAQTSLFQYIKRSHNEMNNSSDGQLFLKPLQFAGGASPPSAKRPRLSFDADENQMIIDAGQKKFGSEQCVVCGMVYDPTFGPDNAQHQKFHERTLSPLVVMPNLSPKALPLVQEHPDGFIFKVTSHSCRSAVQIVEELNALMDRDFGAGDAGYREFWKCGRQVFVFVNRDAYGYDRRVFGCLVVDSLKYAYKRYQTGAVDDRPIYCILGVNRIWVCQKARRKRIATRMMDCARCNFITGYVVQKKHTAFSDPTPNGREFARNYVGFLCHGFGRSAMETAKKFHFNEFLVSVHKHSKSGMKDAGSKFIKSIRKALAKKQHCSAEFYDDVSNWVKTLIIKAYWNFDNQVVVEHKSTKCLDLLEALFSLYIDILSLQHKAKEFNPKDDYFLDKICYYLNASPVHLVNALLRTELTEPGDAVWLEKLAEKTAERISELDKKTIDTNFYLKCIAYYHEVLYLAWGEKDTNKVLKLLHQVVENIEQPDSVQTWFEQTQLECPIDVGKKETKDFLKAKHVSWELCREWLAKLDDDNESESDDEAEESTGTKDIVAQPVNANAEHSLRVFLDDDRIFMKSMATPKPFGNRSTIESPVKDVVDVTKNVANGVARPEVNSPQPVAEEPVVEELGDATAQVSRLRGQNRVSYKSYFLPASSLKRKKSTSPGKSPKKSVNSSGESRDRRESVENDGGAVKEESRSAVPQRYELRLRK